MKRKMNHFLAFFFALSSATVSAASYNVVSPDGKLKAAIIHDEAKGSVSYEVARDGVSIIEASPLGIITDKADFSTGLEFVERATATIDETYTLAVGKVSTYVNRARQIALTFRKNGQMLQLLFRTCNEGIAFRYVIPGKGDLSISGETTGFRLPGRPVFWGQVHPNETGNESDLGQRDGPDFSLALLCEYKETKHWVLLSQAATYGSYCIPYLRNEAGILKVRFPIQQKEPVKAVLPFESPWRVAVVSPGNLSTIVEQTIFENLNPPTEPELKDAAWIRAGRSSWDWLAGDKKNIKGWIDFDAEMGWEYHLLDDGWQGYVGDIKTVVDYARAKNVGLIVWNAVDGMKAPEDMRACFKEYARHGFQGVKMDFFDHLDLSSREDIEDCQLGIQARDNLCRIAAEYKLQLVFHGAAIPTGERRRWPHLLSTEAIKGQEGGTSAQHDNCIPYIRNPLGPVDYSPVYFNKFDKTDAFQLSTGIVFESGILLYADLHKNYLNHPSKELLKRLPASWDEVKFLEGYPASHTVLARRKGVDWYVGGMTAQARTVELPLTFLKEKERYKAAIFKDQERGIPLATESRDVGRADVLKLKMQDRGGFVLHLVPSGKAEQK